MSATDDLQKALDGLTSQYLLFQADKALKGKERENQLKNLKLEMQIVKDLALMAGKSIEGAKGSLIKGFGDFETIIKLGEQKND